jgi:hypothetical protein
MAMMAPSVPTQRVLALVYTTEGDGRQYEYPHMPLFELSTNART